MSDRLFDSRVYVRDGARLVRQIQSIGDALDFLDEWPADRRGMMFEVAQEALYSDMTDDFQWPRRGMHSPRGPGRPTCLRMRQSLLFG